MFGLCEIECAGGRVDEGHDFGGDVTVAGVGEFGLVVLDESAGDFELFRGGGVDCGAVLGANIVALAEALGGVVGFEYFHD